MQTNISGRVLGFDFGTTNSVVARSTGAEPPELVEFAGSDAGAVFRSALCFWEDPSERGGLGCEAGPWAIAEYLDFPLGSRFIQSFKTVAASPQFEYASIFTKRFRFEELGALFLQRLIGHADGQLDERPPRVIVGRPVSYAGARADPLLARERYDRMFAGFAAEIHYVYEPLGAAFSYAARLSEPATLLVADFGGGTSDFSIVRVSEPGVARRCVPLSSTGIGLAGDRFDARIVEHLVLPLLGKGGNYRSSSNRVWRKKFLRCRCRVHGRLRGRHKSPHDGASLATLPRFTTHSAARGCGCNERRGMDQPTSRQDVSWRLATLTSSISRHICRPAERFAGLQ